MAMAEAAQMDGFAGDPYLPIITDIFRPYLLDNFNLTAEFMSELYNNDGITDEIMLTSEDILKKASPIAELLDRLKRLNKTGAYTTFINCLRSQGGNCHHADFIEGLLPPGEVESWNVYRQLIQAFHSRLRDLDAEDMVPYMQSFCREEVEYIKQTKLLFGNTRGAVLLLVIVFKKGSPGFCQLLEGLRGTGFPTLATELHEIVCSSRRGGGANYTFSTTEDTYTGTIVEKLFQMEVDTHSEDNLSGYEPSDPPSPRNAGSSDLSADMVKRLVLYGFQEELLAPALRGINTVLVAPTGCGKTIIAAQLAKAVLDREPGVGSRSGRIPSGIRGGTNKVVYLVNTVPLVEQQRSVLMDYLGADQGILGLSGNTDMGPLVSLLEYNNVLVMTAQILINALKNQATSGGPSDEAMELSKIGLLIFDECHHCQKGFPYNKVMAQYCDLKFSSPDTPRPQVLALTASMGVGKAKGEIDAQNFILKICANLDAEVLCTVQDPSNKEELQQKRPTPEEELIIVRGREDNCFADEIFAIMEKIETIISQTPVGDIWFRSLQRPKHGSLSYENWLVSLEKFIIDKTFDGSMRRRLVTCKDHLKEYNSSLYINRDARTKDALKHLQNFIADLSEKVAKDFNPDEQQLVDFFQEKLAHLRMLAASQILSRFNPLLTSLLQVLLDTMKGKPESRGILFCKTRATTSALVDWIKDTPKLRFLKPGRMIGGRGNEGMSQDMQGNILKMFSEGEHRLIVATSVAQEGINIALCNVVIRYNYISNEIGRVQDRGRSRARGGKFYQIISEEMGLESGVIKNRIRERMMHKATDDIQKMMTNEEFLKRIAELQDNSRRERQLKKKMDEALEHKREKMAVRLLCRKCSWEACTLDEMRCIDNAHRVVLCKIFPLRSRMIAHPSPITKVDFQKLRKIYCGRKDCSQEWGLEMMYKSCVVFSLKANHFIFAAVTGKKLMFSRWKDVTYKIAAMNVEELQTFIANENAKGKDSSGQTSATPVHAEIESPCVVCHDASVNAVLSTCGHMCCCLSCSHKLKETGDTCPMCRGPITLVTKVFKCH